MLIQLLLLISILIIIIAYFRIILIYFKTRKIEIDDINGFDIAKELTSNYDEINIVESNELNISKYSLKRKIIRLTKKDYEANNIFTLAKTSLLSGYSLINLDKDKNISLLSKILPSLDYLNKTPILTLLISIFAKNKGDAKIAIILLIIIIIYQYLINEINNNSKETTKEQLQKLFNKKDYNLLELVKNSFLALNKVAFITSLILIIREILIIIS